MSGTANNPTRRITLLVAGQRFNKWSSVRISRSLKEVAGSFELEYLDEGRLAQSLTTLISPPPYFRVIRGGMSCQIMIDDETVLVGWVGCVKGSQTPDKVSFSITGRDICGDLVDCAASPNGPAEWKNITLTQFASQICAPFKIDVRAETDVGAAFPRLSISPHDKAMAALEKVARQRAVLITSDGVSSLLLTTAGSERAPDGLTLGDNPLSLDFEDNWEKRFSDVFVKGQTEAANGNHRGVKAALNVASPPGASPPPATATTAERAGIVMTGHATDPAVTRWRPDVRMVKTQSGSSSVQVQAEWHVRIDQGQARHESANVVDWRAGPNALLWRPNQLCAVYDPMADVDDDMLIEGVEYLYDDQGSRTALKLVGKTAYDRINEPARARPRHAAKRK